MTTSSTSTSLSTASIIEQIAPLIVVLVVPLLVLYGRNYFHQFALHMLAVASSALPWNWSSIYEHGSVPLRPKKKLAVHTRSEELAARADGRSGEYPFHMRALSLWTYSNATHMAHQMAKRVCYTPGSLIFLERIAS